MSLASGSSGESSCTMASLDSAQRKLMWLGSGAAAGTPARDCSLKMSAPRLDLCIHVQTIVTSHMGGRAEDLGTSFRLRATQHCLLARPSLSPGALTCTPRTERAHTPRS